MSLLYEAILPAGLFAGRPAFGSEGRLYYATDTAVLYRDTGIAWEVYAGGGTHALLSATHPDTDPQGVTRGSLVYGDATPEWSELVIGAAGRVLTVNVGGTEPEWAAAGGGAWTFISETVLVGPAASVNFAAVPGAYRALAMLCQARSSVAAEADGVSVRFNADAGANYDWAQFIVNTGAQTMSVNRGANEMRIVHCEGANSRANNFTPYILVMQGYAVAGQERWCVSLQSGAFGDVSADLDMHINWRRGRWRNTNAVTAILVFPITGPNFVAGSRFALYGIT